MAQFIAEVKDRLDDLYDEWSAWYSFESAYDDGLTVDEAIADCRNWLNS